MNILNTKTRGLIQRSCIALITAAVIFIAAPSLIAQTNGSSKVDPRAERALKETGTTYEVSPRDGIFRITYTTKGKRTQNALVSSDTDKISDSETRVVFSFAMISKTPPTQQVANMLLQENMERVGIWAMQKLPDGSFAIVSLLHLPAASSAKELEDAAIAVATMADDLEERLTKKDVN